MAENICTFNQERFLYQFQLYHSNDEGKIDISQIFYRENILEFRMIQDINEHYAHGILNIKDFSGLTTILGNGDGHWSLSVAVSEISGKEIELSPEEYSYTKIFIVDSVKPTFISPEYNVIEIRFIDPIVQLFKRNVVFSTTQIIGETDITTVLKGLLGVSGIKADMINTIEEANLKTEYITDSNSTLQEHIDYLLEQTYNKDKGFLFLYFPFTESKLNGYWSKTVLEGEIENKGNCNQLFLSSKEKTVKNENGIAGIISYQLSPYRKSIELYKDSFIYTFELKNPSISVLDSGKFTSPDFYNSILQTKETKNTVYPDTILNKKNVWPDFKAGLEAASESVTPTGNYFKETNREEFFGALRKNFLENELICVKVLGKLWRRVGTKFNIIYPNPVGGSRYSGDWFCTKIVDEFKDDEYYQYIFLTRSSNNTNTAESANMLKEISKGKEN